MSSRLRLSVLALVSAAVLLSGGGLRAQALPFLLFERYLDPLRIQAGIPGLSVVILQDDQVVWERGLGYRDVEGSHAATPDTPYAIADLTQIITATLLLHCAERGVVDLTAPVGDWLGNAESPGTTLQQLLTHAAPGSVTGYRYAPSRFALLARPVETCFDGPFRHVVAQHVFDLLAMRDAVPGYDIASIPADVRQRFSDAALARYRAVLERVATPYRVDRRGRATRAEPPPVAVDGAHGLIASARDLAEFDKGLSLHLRPESLTLAWTNAMHNGHPTPFGLGWLVQDYNGQKLVWHFGNFPDAFSSLILKVPDRRLTLILLANSDGLSAPFPLNEGDVTSSLFARTFLRLFL
ncbi:MAG TPA: serine hydrolase domain-containing protein [Vicinamibacterales bacterium]|nr:serine hydrolase domain-containing protein [Vicinamibacterales bacterium]